MFPRSTISNPRARRQLRRVERAQDPLSQCTLRAEGCVLAGPAVSDARNLDQAPLGELRDDRQRVGSDVRAHEYRGLPRDLGAGRPYQRATAQRRPGSSDCLFWWVVDPHTRRLPLRRIISQGKTP